MKKFWVLLISFICMFGLVGCNDDKAIGTIKGLENEYIIIENTTYERDYNSPYSSKDKGKYLGDVTNGNITMGVYSVKGDSEGDNIYALWDWEGGFYVRQDETSVDFGDGAQVSEAQEETTPTELVTTPIPATTPMPIYINPDGTTLETRILPPEGYTRVVQEADSFGAFLRGFTLKPDGSKVHHYDGTEKYDQSAHVAVFDLSLENRDLQQCADSVMRMYGEYYWQSGQYDKIAFHFTNGFLAEYTKWRDGYRIEVNGNDVKWVKKKEYNDSYESFLSYMQIIFSYAGTLSMESEATTIELTDLQIGDVFLSGGSPGHVVMVVDVCENEAGDKAFLLAQGYMPAQEFHVLKKPSSEVAPWYYEEDVVYPFRTPQYTFYEGSLKRMSY